MNFSYKGQYEDSTNKASKGQGRSERSRGQNRDRNKWREKKTPNTVPTIQQ